MLNQLRDKLERNSERIPFTDCVIWIGAWQNKGYGQTRYEGKTILAHRAAYIVHIGKIPDGLFVLHKCDVPSCINPQHLFLGTQKDNIHDMISKGRGRLGYNSEWYSKFCADDIRRFRAMYASGKYTINGLAKKVGITSGGMWKIIRRKTWKELI